MCISFNNHQNTKSLEEKYLQDVLSKILQEFKKNPQDILTMPEVSDDSYFLFASSDGKRIIITESTQLPCLVMPKPYILNNDNFAHMYGLYRALKQGFTFRKCPDLETECWLTIFNHLQIEIL